MLSVSGRGLALNRVGVECCHKYAGLMNIVVHASPDLSLHVRTVSFEFFPCMRYYNKGEHNCSDTFVCLVHSFVFRCFNYLL